MSISAHIRRLLGWLSLSVLVVLGCSACASTASQGGLGDASVPSGWHDADARAMADEMMKEVLAHPWKARFTQVAGRSPVVVVGPLLNRTHDQLNTQALLKELQRALVHSGQIQSVADAGQRQEVRQERAEPGQPSRTETVKPTGQELGADFILQGSINTTAEAVNNTNLTYYQVALELIDIASNVKVWAGQKTLKKRLERGKTTL